MTSITPAVPFNRSTIYGWLLAGFALGGFFDGIVLHQLLQWHHLLSGLEDPLGSDLRFQITMDGLFHLLMYLIAIAGAVLLVAGRATGGCAGTAREILRLSLIGFGTWHVVDALVSHWLIGLHRIRMDSDTPLLWDVGWLIAFGLLPLLIAFLLPPKSGPSRGAAAAVMTVLLLAGLATGAGPRFSEASETIVVFRKDIAPARMMEAVLRADAAVRWTDASGTVWAVDKVSWSGLAQLYAGGALLVSTTPMLAGCLAWTRRA